MDPARWELVTSLFEQVVALPDGARARWLADATADPEIRRAVEALLAADDDAAPVLDATLDELAAAARTASEDGTELIGERIGPWRIVRELGRGGMGTVYLAERADGAYDKQVALKVVKRGMDTDEILRRFRRERQILASLEHPHIARLHDGGMTPDGRPYLVMEHVAGERIDEHARRLALGVGTRLSLMAAVCRAVEYAHQHRVVHRDIKPSNILVTADGDVRLLDFGIARLLDDEVGGDATHTRTGRQLLTPAYASPEQLAGAAVTPAADVYALGVVLHELLTGIRPPDGSTPLRPLRGPLDTVVLKATDARPAARYATAGALADDLDRHRDGRAILARPPSLVVRIRDSLRRRAPLRWAAAIVIALVGIGAAQAMLRPSAPGRMSPASPPTLAVVPTAADPRDSADAYLVHGIGDALVRRLGRLRRLRVMSPRAVAAASIEGATSPSAIGTRLGVTFLLESTIRRRDTMIDIALGLVETKGGLQVWADDYTTTGAGLLALQDSMVRDVASAVSGELSADERMLLGARPSASPVAYDHFMRAGYLLHNRTPASVREAIREYETAIAHDGQFAEAMARLAYAYVLYLDWRWSLPGRSSADLLRAATSLADRAVEIDPGSAEAWLSQAYLRVVRDPLRHEGALAAFARALQLDSLNAETQYQHGQTLMTLGHDEEAIAAYGRALAREPQRAMALVALAAIHANAGKTDDAKRWIDSALAVGSTPVPYALAVWANFTLGWEGVRSADAVAAAARRALALDSSYPAPALSALAMAQAAGGDTTAARATLRALLASIDTLAPTPTDVRFVAPALHALGGEDAALRLLERGQPRGAQLWFYLRSRGFEALRRHPRFQAVWEAADPRRSGD